MSPRLILARRLEILVAPIFALGCLLPATLHAEGSPAPGHRVAASSAAVVDFGRLARQQARQPQPHGPLVGQAMAEPAELEEPDGSPSDVSSASVFHATLTASPAVASPGPLKSFAGLDDIPSVGSSTMKIPPDTDGAVGLTKILEGLNNNYRVLDKATGAVLSTTSIAAFWAPTGFSTTVVDPRTLYDPYNDRWIVCAVANPAQAGSSILLGLSQTGDPEGAYSLYAIDADPADTTWADFPSIGFSQSWIGINVNRIKLGGSTGFDSECLVVDYPSLRAGTFAGTMFLKGGVSISAPCATYSPTEPTLYLPTHISSTSGTYRLDRISGPSGAPTYLIGVSRNRGLTWTQPSGMILPQAAPLAGTSACAPTCKIETQDAQIYSAPVFRDGSIYYAQTVAPMGTPLHTAVQWTRLNASTELVQDGGRIEDPAATSTNGGKWYAYPHLAVNGCGDLIVGYSQFSSAQYAAAGYSFRFGTDSPGTLRDPVIAKSGEDYYHKTFAANGRNRWGDYSKAQVDPSDDVSLWVLDEYAKTRQGTDDGNTGTNSSRWGTWWAKVGPSLSLGSGPVAAEGNSGTTDFNFTTTLTQPVCTPVTVGYTVNPGTATLADNDYLMPGSSIVIPANSTSGTITVKVVGDNKREADETFSVTITSVSAGDIGAANTAQATITNDDPIPTISVAAAAANEGNTGTTPLSVPATLSSPSDQTITVSWATQDGTATVADGDYAAGGGTLTFPPGTTGPQNAVVFVTGDNKRESDEVLSVVLSSPTNATIATGTASATITNDDPIPTISIADASINEGNSGTTPFAVPATLSNPSDQIITVDWATQDGTATVADNDYVAASGTLTFPPGTTGPQNALFNVNGDTKPEGDEVVLVNLTNPVNATLLDGSANATITNDDAVPSLSINDVTIAEGNAGTSTANFTITLSSASSQTVSVAYQTADGTATTAGNDYDSASGTATIPPNGLTAPVSVTIHGDLLCEGNETFVVTLSSPTNATISDGSGQCTITNDDECEPPQVSVLAPNGDEWHYIGDAVDLTWNASDNVGVTSIDLRLSRDGGSSYEDLALGEANDGLYTWTVTGPSTNQALLKVSAHDQAGNTGTDVSDATWHIADVLSAPAQAAVTEFALDPVHPNPARGEVGIGYALPRSAPVHIEVVDVQGRVMAVLVDGQAPAGRHVVHWSPSRTTPSGLFFARARLGGKVLRERFVVTR
jgi:hypothetical protein